MNETKHYRVDFRILEKVNGRKINQRWTPKYRVVAATSPDEAKQLVQVTVDELLTNLPWAIEASALSVKEHGA